MREVTSMKSALNAAVSKSMESPPVETFVFVDKCISVIKHLVHKRTQQLPENVYSQYVHLRGKYRMTE
jgi:hypothetical protein